MRTLLIALAVAATAAAPAVHAGPPAAPSQSVTTTYHGAAVTDPFRNLENVNDPAVRRWFEAQGAYAAEQLAAIPGRDALAARVDELMKAGGDRIAGIVRLGDGRVFYLKRAMGENQFKLLLREQISGPDRVLVDPEQLAAKAGVPHAINYFAPSWDGKYLAYGVSAGGSEDASLVVIETATGRTVAGPYAHVHETNIGWSPDSRHLAFNQLRDLPPDADPTEFYLDTTVQLLSLTGGEPTVKPLFGPLVSTQLKLDRLDVGQVLFQPGSRWMIARTTDTTVPVGRLFVAPVADLARSADKVRWQPIATAADQIVEIALAGDTLYLRTPKGAPMGKILALDLRHPQLARARLAIPQSKDAVIDAFGVAAGGELHANLRRGFTVRTHAWRGGKWVDLAPGMPGNLFADGDLNRQRRDLLLTQSGWTAPPKMRLMAANGTLSDPGLRRETQPQGLPELVATEVMVPSHDGVMVPLAVVHRKGLTRDGSAPTLLTGYASYGFTIEAYNSAAQAAWFERGGVLAFVNARGSGAFGEPWHRAGFKATKPNTWLDGIAAAKWLIANRYTQPARLGVEGGSAGGIFVGRAATTAPELFAAAISNVGMMDTIRSEESANGITNISEFGTVKDEGEFKALLAMSTYDAIKPGVAYPAFLFIHGMNDPRVDVWQSGKAVARLQQTNPNGKPVLLRLDMQAGHGIGSTASQRASEMADSYAFLLWQFGLTDRIAKPDAKP